MGTGGTKYRIEWKASASPLCGEKKTEVKVRGLLSSQTSSASVQTHERPPTSEPKVRAGAVGWAGSEGSSWGPWPGPSRLGLHRQAGPRSRPDGRAWRALMTSVTGYLPLCVSPSQSCPDVCCVGLLGSVWPRGPVEPSVCQASSGSACAFLCSGGKEIARDGGSARPS